MDAYTETAAPVEYDESIEDNYSYVEQERRQLGQTLFVFHAYMNLNVVGPDGVMFNLDAKRLDVINNPRRGTIWLERLHLLPITSTQKPLINNIDGFSVSNMFQGSPGTRQGANPAQGVGSGMMPSRTSNVKGEWNYPGQKIAEMLYTFGRYGLIRVNSLSAQSPDEEQICNDIFRAVMQGIPQNALLEDLPEYFAQPGDFYMSDFIPDKKMFNFSETAFKRIDRIFNDGFYKGDLHNRQMPAHYYDKTIALISELQGSILQAHVAALDPETGDLAVARDSVNKQITKGYDKAAQWLMRQFPSFPLDSTVEKANKQIIRALDQQGGADAPAPVASEDSISFYELYKNEQVRNQQLTERLANFEGKFEQFLSAQQSQPAPAPQAAPPAAPETVPVEPVTTAEPVAPVQPVAPSNKRK